MDQLAGEDHPGRSQRMLRAQVVPRGVVAVPDQLHALAHDVAFLPRGRLRLDDVRPLAGSRGLVQVLWSAGRSTRSEPALGTNLDSSPSSQRTASIRPETAVTSPRRGGAPTFSDSTTIWSPTFTIADLLSRCLRTREYLRGTEASRAGSLRAAATLSPMEGRALLGAGARWMMGQSHPVEVRHR
jgi:hypothetical protein